MIRAMPKYSMDDLPNDCLRSIIQFVPLGRLVASFVCSHWRDLFAEGRISIRLAAIRSGVVSWLKELADLEIIHWRRTTKGGNHTYVLHIDNVPIHLVLSMTPSLESFEYMCDELFPGIDQRDIRPRPLRQAFYRIIYIGNSAIVRRLLGSTVEYSVHGLTAFYCIFSRNRNLISECSITYDKQSIDVNKMIEQNLERDVVAIMRPEDFEYVESNPEFKWIGRIDWVSLMHRNKEIGDYVRKKGC